MCKIKNNKQMELLDLRSFLSSKRRNLLDKSWAGLFREEILEELPVEKLIPFFKESGRPSKKLYTVLRALLLQQFFDYTDEETIAQLSFNIQWHYSFNITEESDSAKYFCERILWEMHKTGIENEIFERVTKKPSTVFKVDTNKQRIDSVYIKSNMRRPGKIGIFSTTIHKFFVNLKRQNKNLFIKIGENITERYLFKKALSYFEEIKPSESAKILDIVSKNLFEPVQQFRNNKDVNKMLSFQLMLRVLYEQCDIDKSDGGRKIKFKKPKEIKSKSLQNPSDPDAAYNSKKRPGISCSDYGDLY